MASRSRKHSRPAEQEERENELARRVRSDDADAFIRDPDTRQPKSRDDLANALGRDFVKAATTGEDVADEDFEQEVPEEVGGPFVESDAKREFAPRPDESNPPDSTKEALPTAMGHGPPTQMDLEEPDEGEAPEGEVAQASGERREQREEHRPPAR